MVSKIDLAYAAGCFDADGTLVITVVNRYKDKEYPAARPCIVGQSMELMQWFLSRWGGRIYRTQGAFHWRPGSSEQFVRDILPFLIVKKRQAELAIQFWQEPRGSDKSHYVELSKALNAETARVFREEVDA